MTSALKDLQASGLKIGTLKPTSIIEIAYPWRGRSRCRDAKYRVVRQLFTLLSPLYFSYFDRDSGTDAAVRSVKCEQITESTWVIPDWHTLDLFKESVLYQGNWILYHAASPLLQLAQYDAGIFVPESLEELVTKGSITTMIVSFADDNPWLLAGEDRG